MIVDALNNIFVINLENRPERWNNFKHNAKNANIHNYRRWLATYGINNNILKSNNLNLCNQKLNAPEIGCFCSHFLVWKEALKLDLDYVIIFEDDVLFVDNFVEKWTKYYTNALKYHNDYDVIYLGGRKKDSTEKGWLQKEFMKPSEYYPYTEYTDKPPYFKQSSKLFFMGAFGYCLSKKFIKELVSFVTTNKITKSLDLFIKIYQNMQNKKCLFCDPLLCYYDESIISDIRD